MAEDWLVKGRSRNERFSSGRSSKDNACNAQPQVFVSNSRRLNQHLGFPCQSFGLTTLYNSSLSLTEVQSKKRMIRTSGSVLLLIIIA